MGELPFCWSGLGALRTKLVHDVMECSCCLTITHLLLARSNCCSVAEGVALLAVVQHSFIMAARYSVVFIILHGCLVDCQKLGCWV